LGVALVVRAGAPFAWQEKPIHGVDQLAMIRALAPCLVLICLTACASRLPDQPANAHVASSPLDKHGRGLAPRVASNDAPPAVQQLVFNTLDVRRGSVWRGWFVTSTNVASVEVRTNLFSLDVPRTAFGQFAFDVDVLDLPPIFIRDYRLRVIARNSAGTVDEEDLPFRIR
jgi:hypothetical protein